MIVPDVSLRAPIAVPVEIRADARRMFRLASNVGEDGLRLAGIVPLEPGRPIEARFQLPDGAALTLVARVACDSNDDEDREQPRELSFVDPPADARIALRRYVLERLELPT
jgi:PilZ domain-containing protein